MNSNAVVSDNIYVLPCLQELKKGGRIFGSEYEQEPSKWENNQLKPLFPGTVNRAGDASSYFDRYWSGKETSIPKEVFKEVSKNGLLNIPNFSDYGFKSQCKEMHITAKWKMYIEFLCDQFKKMNENEKEKKKNNVAILVTHHNRMRDTDLNQGLLPFTSKKTSMDDGEEKRAYANNFCLKIEIEPGQDPSFNVFFPGFPDKGAFKGNCSKNTPNTSANTSFSSDDPTGGGKEYYYEHCNANNINTDLISSSIKDALSGPCSKPMTIFVIRHGNSLHNKPVETSSSINRLDSSLTPLGIYQAKILADQFKQADVFSDSNVILCCSFLQRTQLTGLLLLDYAGVVPIGSKMQEGLNKMREQAVMRYDKVYNKKNKRDDIKTELEKFLNYPPLDSNNFNSFEKDYKILRAHVYSKLENNLYIQPSQGGKRRNRKYTQKVKTRKTRKTRKSRKTRKTRK
jgi:bisphosphoglycerate-dependent phosphoglycerate mutase